MNLFTQADKTNNNLVDYRLRNINPRTEWGCEPLPDSIVRIADDEFLIVVGKRLLHFETPHELNLPSKHLFPHFNGVQNVIFMTLSNDYKHLAISVKLEGKPSLCVVLIYGMENRKNYPL